VTAEFDKRTNQNDKKIALNESSPQKQDTAIDYATRLSCLLFSSLVFFLLSVPIFLIVSFLFDIPTLSPP